MKIKKVEIQGFRAYKHKEDGTFDFIVDDDKPSNFVAIYAPNGFGKSSFYDAVEWAITDHLDRLAGEHNRQNHEYAAKSTKKEGVAQKILRNRDVADDVVTCVNVYTTLPNAFKQSLKKVRSDSRDLRIGNTKSIKNAYFRQVLLSQDEISRFLREAKPQERYKRFMDSFGGDVEILRQELTALINDNKAVIAALEKRRGEFQAKLDEPVNASVFEQFNEIALKVNAEGDGVPLLDASFSADSEHEVLSILITRIHELKSLRNNGAILRNTLVEQLADVPKIQLHFDLIAEQQPRLNKLKKALIDAGRYQELVNLREKSLSELKGLNERLEELNEVNALAQLFSQNQAELAEATVKDISLSKGRADEVAALEKLVESVKEINDDLAAADVRFSALRNALDNCGIIYSEIDTHQARVLALTSEVADQEVALRLNKAQHNIVEVELTKISSLNITVPYLLTSDVSVINFDNAKLTELSDLSEALVGLNLQEQSILKTQDALAEQMGVHERLIATGLQYVSLWPTSTCPLCLKPHESELSLKNKIESADLLSNLSKENAGKLELSSKLKAEIEAKMDRIVQEAITAQMKQIAEFRTKLNELGLSITNKEQEKSRVDAEKQALTERIESLQASISRLSKEEFLSKAESELRALTEKRNEYLALKEKLEREVDAKNVVIGEYDSSIKSLNSRVAVLTSELTYRKVAHYIRENGLLPTELKVHCVQKAIELEKLREERRAEADEMTNQSRALQEAMVADGTWIDFAALASQKEQVQAEILRSESVIATFHDSISRMIGPQNGKSLSEVKSKLSEYIDTQDLSQKALDDRVKNIELLSELLKAATLYLAHLSLRAMLKDVDEDLTRRYCVDAALIKERNLVVEELKRLIKAFFHEDLIDSIYRKIDPHPSFKKVEFRPDFETTDRPGLNIVLNEETGSSVSPILYFSTAQLNILSLSVFLAGALHAKDDLGKSLDVIMIDDPIQSMDSINILATIDLLRSISVRLDKQIIISTHDDNFFGLLQRKIPSAVLGSKFLKLEKFGRVVPVEPIRN